MYDPKCAYFRNIPISSGIGTPYPLLNKYYMFRIGITKPHTNESIGTTILMGAEQP